MEIDYEDRDCPARRALDLVSDKWTARAVLALFDGPKRYNTLRRDLNGISQRMLTRTLRRLEAEQLVTRTVFASVPPKVEYELTGTGRSMRDPILAIARWGTESLSKRD